jgi:GcrA cell cycle regulator
MTFHWSQTTTTELRRLWAQGDSIREIHRKMAGFGVPSHNSVQSKARRIGLPPRESPIKPLQPGQSYAPKKPCRKKPRLPPLSNFEAEAPEQLADAAPEPIEEPEADPTEISDAPVIERPAPKAGRCHYPIGHPRTPGFHFCGARLRQPNRPYCAEHAAICFQPATHEGKNAPLSAR